MTINKVYEPLVKYSGQTFGGATRYDHVSSGHPSGIFGDSLLMNQISEDGIPYPLFEEMQQAGPLLLQEWADILDISARTLTRYREEGKVFSSSQSAVILRLTEILALGMEVFGEKGKLRAWLTRETYALGSRSPLSLLTNGYGQELVLRELYAIEHGIFA